MGKVWDLDLPHNKKFVLLAYADHADHDGENVYPSLERVAHKTGYSRDQIRRIAGELVKDGLMEKVAPATHDHPARYRLTLDRGSNLQPLKPKRGVANDPSGVGANDPSREGAQMPPEPSVEPSVEPSDSPRGGDCPEVKPAKALTTLTVERTEEVGFFASKEQKANWGRGWSSFVYVGEGKDPPDAERQFAVLSEIVAAAAGRLGKTRFFLSVQDAVKRVDERRPGGRTQAPESRERDRMEGYEFLVDDSEPPSPEELKERLERLRRAS
jgi:hypothetical protein